MKPLYTIDFIDELGFLCSIRLTVVNREYRIPREPR